MGEATQSEMRLPMNCAFLSHIWINIIFLLFAVNLTGPVGFSRMND